MRAINIGGQGFDRIRESGSFYVDKTDFIKEWRGNEDDVTLITRPRRFGKTLNLSMLECFFSNKYAGRADLFEGLSIWNSEKFRKLQGTYPVIFLSFATIKQNTYEGARMAVIMAVQELFQRYKDQWEDDPASEKERYAFMNPL